MSVSRAAIAKSQPVGKVDAHVPNEIDLSIFNLRDTLSGITVRDANFSEFLAVLKKNGVQASKPN